MIKLIDILLENPDTIKIDDKNYDFKSDAASHTFLVYYDEIDNKEYWVAYVYPKYRKNGKAILCENKEVEKILNDTRNIKVIKKIDSKPSHINLGLLLFKNKRINTSKEYFDIKCSGRLFFNKYFTFWAGKNTLINYKNKLIDFLNDAGVNINNVLIEDHITREYYSKLIPFNDYFNISDKELSSYEKARLELAKKLHMNKGILDKSVSDVIRSEPKDVETLYARLEKQLNMPIAQIKQIFKDVPLDKLIAKELKEYIIKIKKS